MKSIRNHPTIVETRKLPGKFILTCQFFEDASTSEKSRICSQCKRVIGCNGHRFCFQHVSKAI